MINTSLFATATMNTKTRILTTSLRLFNAQGERNVSTNAIAAELSISPGNLYYHFKNKQAIILQLFLDYEARVRQALQRPERHLTIDDKVHYLTVIFSGLWEYRFIHRDLEHLLSSDEHLQRRYRTFFKHTLKQVAEIYQGLVDADILSANAKAVEHLALNTWIIVTSWFSFLRCHLLDDHEDISQSMLNSGIHQIIELEKPFVTERFKDDIDALQATFEGLTPSQ